MCTISLKCHFFVPKSQSLVYSATGVYTKVASYLDWTFEKMSQADTLAHHKYKRQALRRPSLPIR